MILGGYFLGSPRTEYRATDSLRIAVVVLVSVLPVVMISLLRARRGLARGEARLGVAGHKVRAIIFELSGEC